jgi:hypothetical protein
VVTVRQAKLAGLAYEMLHQGNENVQIRFTTEQVQDE